MKEGEQVTVTVEGRFPGQQVSVTVNGVPQLAQCAGGTVPGEGERVTVTLLGGRLVVLGGGS